MLSDERNISTAVGRNGGTAGAALRLLPTAPQPQWAKSVTVGRRGAHVAERAPSDDSSFLPDMPHSYAGTVKTDTGTFLVPFQERPTASSWTCSFQAALV